MAKRKRNQARASNTTQPIDLDTESKLQFKSYEDLADSEDDFHLQRDRVALEDGPEVKKRRGYREPDEIELSDEEVLAYPDSDDVIDDDELSIIDQDARQGQSMLPRGGDNDASEQEENPDGDDEDLRGWGTAKSDYYGADKIEEEQDALDEEVEARRLQQKRLKALREADFAFDTEDWLADEEGGKENAQGLGRIVTEILPQFQVTEGMGPEERSELLRNKYPEFEPLSKELLGLHQHFEDLRKVCSENSLSNTSDSQSKTLQTSQFQALATYMGALALYFAIMTSPANEHGGKAMAMHPSELRQHEVMTFVFKSRTQWNEMKELQIEIRDSDEISEMNASDSLADEDSSKTSHSSDQADPASKTSRKISHVKTPDAAVVASQARRAERLRRVEESLATISQAPKRTKRLPRTGGDDDNSDIGDEQALTNEEANEKARHKKSLRFYTSQIAQKANKRANAGRAAGGDDDVPYRERFRDRQERLMREAENRGRRTNDKSDMTSLAQQVSDEERSETNLDREQLGSDEEALERKVMAKKRSKEEREEVYRQAGEEGGTVRHYEEDTTGPDGKRKVTYAIEKNKGLMPRRKKENKNPRVKKRKRFEDKSKKLRSMKATYQGGEGRGGYGGELTGIKSNLVRSVKL